MTASTYTDQQKINIANRYLIDGISQKELAKEYNLHYNTIKKYVRSIKNNIPISRTGLKGKRTKTNKAVLSNALKEKIALEHIDDGIPIKDLAVKYKCDRVSISNYVKNIRNGKIMHEKGKSTTPKSKGKTLSEEDKQNIAKEYLQGGVHQKDLAIKYQVSVCSISNYVKRVESGVLLKDERTKDN